MVLAMQRACKSVKNSLRAQGFKVSDYTAAEITTLARTYLTQHRERLVADAKQIIATSPLFERCRRRYRIR
jgi:hypothetical protein